jgi:alanine-synthesizing transaminase
LWSASVTLNGGRPVHYDCEPRNGFLPDVEQMERLITARTRAVVLINPNNPTGAVYPAALLEDIARMAERHGLVVMSDEIYDHMTYDGAEFVPMATLVRDTLCITYGGLSKVYRACGYRVGWCSLSGTARDNSSYIEGLELLAALRLCSNVPSQWAVQTALGGYQSIYELTAPGGRLYQTRQAVIDAIEASPWLTLVVPAGSMYAFVGVDTDAFGPFDDETFALRLLEEQSVLLAPGSSFNTPYRNHFRITLLPEPEQMAVVFERINAVLVGMQSEQSGVRAEA